MIKKDKGICIRAIDYSDSSQIITFFTEKNGKLSAIAKGSKRPKSAFSGPLEVLSAGELVFNLRPTDKLATLREFDQNFFPIQIRKNLLAINSAFFVAELLNSFTTEFDQHQDLYRQAISFLNDIQSAKNNREVLALLILFQLVLFREAGFAPVFAACANCKMPYNPTTWPDGFFSSSANGLICRDCQGSFPDRIFLDAGSLVCIGKIEKLTIADQQTLAFLEGILISHITEKLSKPPKMANMILKLTRP